MAKYVNFYGKVMFLHLSLNHSVHGGRGVYPSMHWGRQPSARADIPLGRHPQQTHPLARHPCPVYAGIHTPLPSACWETHPLAQCMLGYTPPCPVHAGIHTPLPSACWDTHPPLRRPLLWTVRILLECILVQVIFSKTFFGKSHVWI